MRWVLRGVRVVDPAAGVDICEQDVLFEAGRLVAIASGIETAATEVDLTPSAGREPCVLCPGFIDLHAHLREPGGERAETLASGARAAAAGGFTQVVAMANTTPPCDTPGRVAAAVKRAVGLPVRVLTVAALTRGLGGDELVDIEGCAAAGAVAFSDDGRNAAGPALLTEGLRRAARVDRPVLIHPEDESLISATGSMVRCPDRPAAAEIAAVEAGLAALTLAGAGRLHLQHLSTAGAAALASRARTEGLRVTGEVTPHHLAMSVPLDPPPDPAALAKVNPPLRDAADREAMVEALLAGVIDAVATDHAPHPADEKQGPYQDAAPGMIGLETALATCLAAGEGRPGWLPMLVERLTVGPGRVLGPRLGLQNPGLRLGEPATCVVFDPAQEWEVAASALRSLSSNTPLLSRTIRGKVLMTMVEGSIAHVDSPRLGVLEPVAHG